MALCAMLRIMSICKLLNMGLRVLGVWVECGGMCGRMCDTLTLSGMDQVQMMWTVSALKQCHTAQIQSATRLAMSYQTIVKRVGSMSA